jgi:hypothetical protein
VDEFRQLIRLRKPHQSVNVIRHHNEADALRGQAFQLAIEDAEQNSFRMIEAKELTAAINRTRQEVNVKFVVEGTSLVGHEALNCRRTENRSQLWSGTKQRPLGCAPG